MTTHKTVFDSAFKLVQGDHEWDDKTSLTEKLDKGVPLFDQSVINEIVLWKVNRFAEIDIDTLHLLNDIDPNATEIDPEKTKAVLVALIKTKGIKLAMASTILSFRNKNIYQIIDQRVYRIINKGLKLKVKTHPNEKNLNHQIDLYLQYLKDLKVACNKLKIPFDRADRILFNADRRVNKVIRLDNY